MSAQIYYNNDCDVFDIDRIDYADVKQYLPDCIARNKPLVISGLARQQDIKAFQWNMEYLRSKIGKNPTNVVQQPSGYYTFDDEEERTMRAMTFDEFADKASSEDTHFSYYLLKSELSLYPEIEPDIKLPDNIGACMKRQKPYGQYLFIGANNIVSGLHYDAVDAFNIQIRGKKRFTLFPPLGRDRFYPYSALSQAGHISRVNADKPNYESFPAFREVEMHRIDVVLEEGDALYIPACWWHQVESLGSLNINATYWFYPPFYKIPRMFTQYAQSLALQTVRLWKFKTIHMPRAKK